MRGIETEEVKESRNKRNRLIGGIVLMAVLILSTLGYSLMNYTSTAGNTEENVNNNELTYNGQYWSIQKYGKQLYFTYSKNETSSVPIEIVGTLNNLANVYVDSGKDDVSFNELAFNLNGLSKIQKACYGKCSEDLPEKGCDNETLIVIRDSGTPSVKQDKSCIFIDGNLLATDAFLYKIFGI